jgi:hypothetical protein
VKTRAVNLLKFGAHLSEGLLDLARSLAPSAAPEPDEDSPYRD